MSAANRRTRRQVACRQSVRSGADAPQGGRDRPRQNECRKHCCRRRPCRDRKDLQVGAHVEHHPARQEDRGEGDADSDQGKTRQLKPDRRRPPQQVGEEEPRDEAAGRDDEGELNHGSRR